MGNTIPAYVEEINNYAVHLSFAKKQLSVIAEYSKPVEGEVSKITSKTFSTLNGMGKTLVVAHYTNKSIQAKLGLVRGRNRAGDRGRRSGTHRQALNMEDDWLGPKWLLNLLRSDLGEVSTEILRRPAIFGGRMDRGAFLVKLKARLRVQRAECSALPLSTLDGLFKLNSIYNPLKDKIHNLPPQVLVGTPFIVIKS